MDLEGVVYLRFKWVLLTGTIFLIIFVWHFNGSVYFVVKMTLEVEIRRGQNLN